MDALKVAGLNRSSTRARAARACDHRRDRSEESTTALATRLGIGDGEMLPMTSTHALGGRGGRETATPAAMASRILSWPPGARGSGATLTAARSTNSRASATGPTRSTPGSPRGHVWIGKGRGR